MKKRKAILTTLALLVAASSTSVKAQSIWANADVKAKITKKLSANVGVEYRTTEGVDGTDRIAAGADLNYKLLKWLKVSAGYTFIDRHTDLTVTKKGNYVNGYWQQRHRFAFTLTGSYSWNRFTFSLRERYQYTHNNEQTTSKWDKDDGTREDEVIESSNKHVLRSRLEIDYDIKKSGFTPFVSCELYNSLQDAMANDKTRWTVGTDYKINKKHSVTVYYRYIDHADEDEDDAKHIIGVGYQFKI